MGKVNVIYKEYASFIELTNDIKADMNSMLDKDLASSIENEIANYLAENEIEGMAALLGYGESNNKMVCFDLTDGSSILKSWILGSMKRVYEETS